MRDVIRADQIHGMARERALELPGTEVYPFTEGWEAGRVAGKWFVLFTELEGTPIINVKAAPADVRLLTSTYEGVTPSYHMNKKHWVALCLDVTFCWVGALARPDRSEMTHFSLDSCSSLPGSDVFVGLRYVHGWIQRKMPEFCRIGAALCLDPTQSAPGVTCRVALGKRQAQLYARAVRSGQ